VLRGSRSPERSRFSVDSCQRPCRLWMYPIIPLIDAGLGRKKKRYVKAGAQSGSFRWKRMHWLAADRTHARKRGADATFVSWDPWMAEAPSELTLSREALNPAEVEDELRYLCGALAAGSTQAA
jgi:hypothetical protein